MEIIFEILEYYEACTHLDISSNKTIGTHGWVACARAIRKVILMYYKILCLYMGDFQKVVR